MEQHAAEVGRPAEVLVDAGDDLQGIRVERRQPVVSRLVGAVEGLHRQGGVASVVRQPEGEHGHPGEHPHARPGAELPGHPVEQVRAQRQVPVREVQRVRHAVTVRVGERLQEHVVDAQRLDPVQQPVEVAALLLGIGIVDVVEVDVGRPQRRRRVEAADRADEIVQVHVRADQPAVHVALQRGVRQVFEGHAELEAEPVRLGGGGGLVGAVGPHHGARPAAEAALQHGHALGQVGADARAVGGLRFVAAVGGPIGSGDRGGLSVAPGIAGNAPVQVVAVGRDLHQARIPRLADLRPGHEPVPGHQGVAVGHRPVRRRLDPARHRREHRGKVEQLQQRQHVLVEAGVAVVEGQQHRLVGQRPAAAGGGPGVQADGRVAVRVQPGELLHQRVHGDGGGVGHAGRVGHHVVVAQRQQTPAGGSGRGRCQQCRQQCRQQQRRRQQRRLPQRRLPQRTGGPPSVRQGLQGRHVTPRNSAAACSRSPS